MSSQRTAPGLITDQLMTDFHMTAGAIGFVTSIQFFVYTSLQIPMGIFADRFGANIFLIFGAAITGIGTIMYSVATLDIFLIAGRLLAGIGDATIWVNMVLILSLWFTKEEFTRFIGIAAMTGSLGFLLATVPYAFFIEVYGWRITFFFSGMTLCICAILLYFVLVVKPKKSLFIKREVVISSFDLLRKIFFHRQAWALFFCHFGIVGTYVGFISSWGVLYGMEIYGMTLGEASILIMLGLIGALIGAPLASFLSSRLGKIKQPYLVVHLLLFCCWGIIIFLYGKPPLFLLFPLFFLIGLLYGANALTFASVRQSFPVEEAGIASGFANTGGFLSAVLLPVVFGKVLDIFSVSSIGDGYYYGLFVPFIFSIVGVIGVIMLREKM